METIRWNMSPAEIEQESFRRIEAECDLHRTLSAPHWRVARRLIHTTADMHIADTLVFRHDPVAAGLAALRRKAPIFCDSQMLRSGLSLPKLRTLHPGYGPEDLHCYITDPDVVERARTEGHTRALCSAEKARPLLDGGIVLIGNAPLALARIARYILEEGVRPALVVGMPEQELLQQRMAQMARSHHNEPVAGVDAQNVADFRAQLRHVIAVAQIHRSS